MNNHFVKSIAAISFLMICHVVCAAQTTCELNGKSVPLLLDLQIGMSPAAAQAIFGRDLKIKIKEKGERTFFQNFIKKPAPPSLRGVRALYLRFYDGRLYQIEIFYEPRPDLPTVEAIAAVLAAQFEMPDSFFQIEFRRVDARCGTISLAADNVLNPRIELTDETIRSKIEALHDK